VLNVRQMLSWGYLLFDWLRWRRKVVKIAAEDADTIPPRSGELSAPQFDPDQIAELVRIVGGLDAGDPRPHRDAGTSRRSARRSSLTASRRR